MAVHLAARLHSYVHGLFRPKDKTETHAMWLNLESLYREHGLLSSDVRNDLIERITDAVLARLALDPQSGFIEPVRSFIRQAFDYQSLFIFPEIDWEEKRSVSEWWEIKDSLQHELDLFINLEFGIESIEDLLFEIVKAVHDNIAVQTTVSDVSGALVMPVKLLQSLEQAAIVTEKILLSVMAPESDAWALFSRMAHQISANTELITSGNPFDTRASERPPLMPKRSDFETADNLITGYLGKTPVADLLAIEDKLIIPENVRTEHSMIVAGSGHGKSQTLQYLICNDLKAVAEGKRSVVVIDSQGDLINNISSLAEFGPNGDLRDRVVIIDPTDVEWPVCLNLFDVGTDRLDGYPPLERERLTNSVLELYDFILGSLLDAGMTQKQNVIFRYVTRLMLVIPNATIHTLIDLMEKDATKNFAPYIEKLTGTPRRFFDTEFNSPEFNQTKKQVLRRLWGILENQTFERMFSHPKSKLDFFTELNSGKIILINTAKDLLKDQGSQIFGRFFIALISQAAQERATLPKNKRLMTNVYIDEAADYFDQNITTILAQARKQKVGITAAWQYLGQTKQNIQDAFAANTSIKLAGGVSAKDTKALAPMLHCNSRLIEDQPKGHFASYVRGVTENAVSLRIPFGYLEKKDKMAQAERQELLEVMRRRYAVHHTKISQPASDEDTDDQKLADDTIAEQKPPPKKKRDADNPDISPKSSW